MTDFAQENDSISLRTFSPALRQGTKKCFLFAASADKHDEKRILCEKTIDHVREKKNTLAWNESREGGGKSPRRSAMRRRHSESRRGWMVLLKDADVGES